MVTHASTSNSFLEKVENRLRVSRKQPIVQMRRYHPLTVLSEIGLFGQLLDCCSGNASSY